MAETARRKALEVAEVTLNISLDAPEDLIIPAARVTLPAPMLKYRCNEQGCCCSGWRILFKPNDLVRLRKRLDSGELEILKSGIELDIELDEDGDQVVKSAQVLDENKACRFLAPDKKMCGIHAKHGISALPDICVDFPVVSYDSPGGVDFYFDPVCPSVLDALFDEETPVTITTVEAPFKDDGFMLRSAHSRGEPIMRLGASKISIEQADTIRRTVVASLADQSRPVWQHLLAIDDAYAQLARGERPAEAFELRYDHDPAEYMRFLFDCLGAHGIGTLERSFFMYQRFIFALPMAPEAAPWDELADHLEAWQPAMEKWLAPADDRLRALHLRYLAHRHFSPFITIGGELKFAAGAIVHTYATALRYASAFGAVFRREVDRDITKVAFGASEYVYRSLEIPPESLPWWGITT